MHITTGASRGAEVVLFNERDEPIFQTRIPNPDGGSPVTVPVPSWVPENVRVRAGGQFVITFRAEEHLEGRAVTDVLATCIRYVDLRVLQLMKAFVGSIP